MARDDLIQATGSVDKILGGGRYQITLENGQQVTAQLSGRMRRFRIRVIPGDRVTVGLNQKPELNERAIERLLTARSLDQYLGSETP